MSSKPPNQPSAPPRQPVKVRYTYLDVLFWLMMFFINVPDLLTIWGIDTMFKPYRMISLYLALVGLFGYFREQAITSQFSRPLMFAILYGTTVTAIFAGMDVFANIPLVATCTALFFSTYVVSSKRSLVIGLYTCLLSYIVSSYFGLLAFDQGEYRLKGLFENPNTFGFAGCFVVILVINRYFPMPTFLRVFFVLVTIPVMVLSGSRGTMLSLIVGVGSQTWRNPKLFLGFLCFGVFGFVASLFFEEQLSQLTDQYGSRSVFTRFDTEVIERGSSGRFKLISSAFQVGTESGFVGIGFGQFRLKHFTRFVQKYRKDGTLLRLGTHNIYMTILVEWGFVPFICFGLIMFRLVKSCKHLQFEKDWIYGFLAISAVNGIGNDLVGEVHFWVFLGICVQCLRFSSPPRVPVRVSSANETPNGEFK